MFFSPYKHHEDYFAYRVLDRPSSNIQISFSVHINRRKLFEQVANSIGDSSTLNSNHAVFLKPIFRAGSENFAYLSDIIDDVLPRLVISVARPTNFGSFQRRNELFDLMDVPLVYLECDQSPDYHSTELMENVAALDLEMQAEVHKVRLSASCIIIPVICRRQNPGY